MKKFIFLIVIYVFVFPSNHAYGWVADWVNNQGCYCGGYSSVPVSCISRGDGTLDERTASMEQLEYWNNYADIYSPSIDTDYGAPGNGLNEINTFITNTAAQSIYGYSMSPYLYGVAIIQPDENFGTFNECKDFTPTGCDNFTETDVLINAEFYSGWSTDISNYNNALVQTTALHEIGHTLGAHHIFSLPAFGDSYSTMNYINDDSGRFVTRMDANTIRAHYPSVSQEGVDIGIFPFIFGNSDYGESYTVVFPLSVRKGEPINISDFLIQNIGTIDASNTVITFYLSSDTTIENTDHAIGTVEYAVLPADSDNDLSVILEIPEDVPEDTYYIGAIVTVDGAADAIDINNKFIIGRSNPTQITVSGAAPITQTIIPPLVTTVAPGNPLGPFRITHTNNTDSDYSYVVLRYLIKPDSTLIKRPPPLFVNLQAGEIKEHNAFFFVPPWSGQGSFWLGFVLHDTSHQEIDHDSFSFTVSGSSSSRTQENSAPTSE